MSVKDQVRKNQEAKGASKQEETQEKVGRKSAGVGTESAEQKVEREPATVTRVLGGRETNPQWYLEHTDDLEDVTSEDSNPVLGITKIYANPASAKQMKYGTIANVTIDTVIGKISGLQIRESQKTVGAIFLTESSRDISKEGQDAKWVSDVKLDKRVKAQVLSYVETLLEPVKK